MRLITPDLVTRLMAQLEAQTEAKRRANVAGRLANETVMSSKEIGRMIVFAEPNSQCVPRAGDKKLEKARDRMSFPAPKIQAVNPRKLRGDSRRAPFLCSSF